MNDAQKIVQVLKRANNSRNREVGGVGGREGAWTHHQGPQAESKQ